MIPIHLQCTDTTESFNSFYAASPWLFKDQQQTQASVHHSFHCMCNLMNRYSRELNRVITVWNYSGPVYVGEYQNSTALMTVFHIRLPTVYWTALWRNVKGRWNSKGTVIGVRTMKTSMFKLGMSKMANYLWICTCITTYVQTTYLHHWIQVTSHTLDDFDFSQFIPLISFGTDIYAQTHDTRDGETRGWYWLAYGMQHELTSESTCSYSEQKWLKWHRKPR